MLDGRPVGITKSPPSRVEFMPGHIPFDLGSLSSALSTDIALLGMSDHLGGSLDADDLSLGPRHQISSLSRKSTTLERRLARRATNLLLRTTDSSGSAPALKYFSVSIVPSRSLKI
jgi:hypothetical protein